MNIHHYSVFAAAPGGGKQFAIVEGVDNPVDMQRIAASSGQPLTGFILSADSGLAEVRFFSPTKEKGSSDSGALVVGEHLRRAGAIRDRLTVNAGGERLEIGHQNSRWWSAQEDASLISRPATPIDWTSLHIDEAVLDSRHGPVLAGNSKHNLIVMVKDEAMLDALEPDLDAMGGVQEALSLNGLVFCVAPGRRADVDIRFFSPARGISEDNAGSYTAASVCGFTAYLQHQSGGPDETYESTFAQGYAMGRPSRLFVNFTALHGTAAQIRVGGTVKPLEVTAWD